MKEKPEKKQPYNPLDKINLGRSVADALLKQVYNPLPPSAFEGVGIYAIYYFGDNPRYSQISKFNHDIPQGWPIYIGKAIQSGGRKGVLNPGIRSKSLFSRLTKHSQTIQQVSDLSLKDFKCRYLTIDSIWIPLGEQLLIDKYKPLWNSSIDGFGNNDPGKNRYDGAIPDWHLLHAGVGWVKRMSKFQEEVDLSSLHKKIKEAQEQVFKELTRDINRK